MEPNKWKKKSKTKPVRAFKASCLGVPVQGSVQGCINGFMERLYPSNSEGFGYLVVFLRHCKVLAGAKGIATPGSEVLSEYDDYRG